jgi:hypothetical protein
MTGAIAGNAPGDDLPPLRHELFEHAGVFVIDGQFGVHTKAADFAADKELFAPASR